MRKLLQGKRFDCTRDGCLVLCLSSEQ